MARLMHSTHKLFECFEIEALFKLLFLENDMIDKLLYYLSKCSNLIISISIYYELYLKLYCVK